MDVSPHNANPQYTPNLTKQYGLKADNHDEMTAKFNDRRATQDEEIRAEKERIEETNARNDATTQEIINHLATMGDDFIDPQQMDMK